MRACGQAATSGRSPGHRARGATDRCRPKERTPAASSADGSASAVSEIRLEEWEREWAGHVGLKRHEANIRKRDARHYDPARMQDNLTASIASAVAELAVAKRLNRYWDGSFWKSEQHSQYSDRADVGDNTEVRRVRSRWNPLPVRARDVQRNRIMVLAFPLPDEFVQVEVIGWGWAVDLWPQGSPAPYDPDGNTRLVVQECLNPL